MSPQAHVPVYTDLLPKDYLQKSKMYPAAFQDIVTPMLFFLDLSLKSPQLLAGYAYLVHQKVSFVV